MSIQVRYDDPEFSQRYDLTSSSAQATALLEVTALAWNREYSDVASAKYTTTDPHIVDMAALYARVLT